MSKALKCDICGAFFNGLIRINVVNKKTIPNSIKVYHHAQNGNIETVFDYDICPECYQAIKKTLDDRKKLRVSPYEDDRK